MQASSLSTGIHSKWIGRSLANLADNLQAMLNWGVVNFKDTGHIPNSVLGDSPQRAQRFLDGKVEVVISMVFATPVVIGIMGVFAGGVGVCRELNGGAGVNMRLSDSFDWLGI